MKGFPLHLSISTHFDSVASDTKIGKIEKSNKVYIIEGKRAKAMTKFLYLNTAAKANYCIIFSYGWDIIGAGFSTPFAELISLSQKNQQHLT